MMASQSHLFKGLVEHASFVMIDWSIWLKLVQSKKIFRFPTYKEKNRFRKKISQICNLQVELFF